jgi:single-strand DNA-binding protein
MANFNKVILIGRLTRDPESRTFANGGKVASFGFAVSTRRKNSQTGQWEDGDPMFIDIKVYNRGDQGTLANRVEETLRKGQQVFIEGHLVLEQWEDKQTGQKRSKHVVVVDNFQYLQPRDGGSSMGGSRFQQGGAPAQASTGSQEGGYEDAGPSAAPPEGRTEEEIPF